ncbi:MAG: methyltransferase domain-containing protein [Thermoanaerobaculia bacterium]
MPSLWHYLRRAPFKTRKLFLSKRAEKLHVGSGSSALAGWVNIDNQKLPGVDAVIDVTFGLPFRDVGFIFAEHFIEHLSYNDAMYFLAECRRVLRDDGVLRLSTPNLDWVWASHYRRVLSKEQETIACFALNRGFRGWGHQFLYNFGTLAATLRDAGFANVVRCDYGTSAHPELAGLESHEKSEDYEGISHILIVEASGRGGGSPGEFVESRDLYLRDLNVR